MCTYNITIDENMLEHKYPGISRDKFGQWLQQWVDDVISGEPSTAAHVSPNAHPYEEMKSALHERIENIEAGKAVFHTNDEVFSSIRERYGL